MCFLCKNTATVFSCQNSNCRLSSQQPLLWAGGKGCFHAKSIATGKRFVKIRKSAHVTNAVKRLFQITDQILNIFDTNRQTQRILINPAFFLIFFQLTEMG